MLQVVGEFAVLLLVGIAGGGLNSLGGGGTFVVLPALVAAGVPPVTANAGSTVALLPGSLSGAWAYRGRIAPVGATPTAALTCVSALGGGLGAALLLVLPESSFAAAVPWLLAFATVVLAGGRWAATALVRRLGRPIGLAPRGVLLGQFVLAIYGGYFGGAVGIMMLALWTVGLAMDAATGNPMRVAQVAAVYAPAAAVFLVSGEVLRDPLPIVAVLVGAVLGGWGGAHVARRLPARVLRGVVLVTAVTMTVLYFWRS